MSCPANILAGFQAIPGFKAPEAERLCGSLLGHVQQSMDARADDIGYGLNSAWLILCGERAGSVCL